MSLYSKFITEWLQKVSLYQILNKSY